MTPLAGVCAWCGRSLSRRELAGIRAGGRASHGICDDCTAREFPGIYEDEPLTGDEDDGPDKD